MERNILMSPGIAMDEQKMKDSKIYNMKELTPKQESFAQAVASGKTQADAYRASFNASKMKASTIQESASRLMADCKVSARVAELRKPIVEAAQITLSDHLSRLATLSDLAEKEGKYSAAVAAEVARGKAAGLYVEKIETSGPNGGPIESKVTIDPKSLSSELLKELIRARASANKE